MLRYQSRISGPLLDRIDLYVDVPSVEFRELRSDGNEETSSTVRARVCAARRHRQLGAAMRLTPEAEQTLAKASRRMSLSARGISRTLDVARTVACLDHADQTDAPHVSVALQFRVPRADPAQGEDNERSGTR